MPTKRKRSAPRSAATTLVENCRARMTAVFLAALDELAHSEHFASGTLAKPTLDTDTVVHILLEQVDDWHRIPYSTIRKMFAALLASAPLDDVEALLARVSGEVETMEHIAGEEQDDERRTYALVRARKAVDALAESPATLRHFAELVPVLANRALGEESP